MKHEIDMKKIKNKYIRARVTEEVKEMFEAHCIKYNFIPSQRLRVIIEKEIKGEIKG